MKMRRVRAIQFGVDVSGDGTFQAFRLAGVFFARRQSRCLLCAAACPCPALPGGQV